MRIAVDGRHLAAGRGVARYSHSMVDALRAGFASDEWAVGAHGRAWHASAALIGHPRMGRGTDVAWLPAPAPVAVARGVPYVLTVHDLAWVGRPEDFTAYERAWHSLARLRRLAARAAFVVASSEVTKALMVERWDIDEDRVVRVQPGPGLGATADVVPATREERKPRPYFLCVGALEPRKDPVTLARAYARARERGLRAELWFAGGGRLASAVAGEGVRVLGPQTDEQLHDLYANATAVVHPALVEGFGFTPIEALAHGTPPLVANLPVYDETVGTDGALRFPPSDTEQLTEALLTIEADESLRATLVAAGQTAIAALSWDRAAEETHAIIAKAANR